MRFVVQRLGEDRAFEYLRELEPLLWRGGRTYPKSEAELNRLFGDGQVDIAMSYDPGFVEAAVRQGSMPRSTRPLVLEGHTLQNVSFVTIPANAANRAGALVIANLLVTHDRNEAAQLGHTLAVMLEGRIVQHGPPRELFERPSSPVLTRFLGMRNLQRGAVRKGRLVLDEGSVQIDAPDGPALVAIRPEHVQLTSGGPPDHERGEQRAAR